MLKKIKINDWKPVKIEGSIVTNLEGLIGIEECTNYDLETITKDSIKKKRKSLKQPSAKSLKKQKTSSEEDILSSKNDSNEYKATVTPRIKKIDLDSIKPWTIVPLREPLLRSLAIQKFTQPTEIQQLTLAPAILGKRDILGAAETGSGKTLAFGLPILNGILRIKEEEEKNETVSEDNNENLSGSEDDIDDLDENGLGCVKSIDNIELPSKPIKPLYALVLTPTRELAIQIKNHLVSAAQFTGIRIAVVVGGMSVEKQERILSKGPEVVIATPGRLWNLLSEGNVHLNQIENIKYLAIDETDRMIEKGHFQELHQILEKINSDETKRKQRQNFVFSATLTLIHELPKRLVLKNKFKTKKNIGDMSADQKLRAIVDLLGITNPKVVDITKGKGTSQTLTESKITCTIDEKDYYLYYFLKRYSGRTLVFCNSIGCVRRLVSLLSILGCKPLPLHASMQQRQRLKNLDKFKDDETGLLIATDVAARGLDIPSVQHVLHYQTPRTSESYVHRSGRTARATKEGLTVLLVEPDELQSYLRLCRTLGKTEDIPQFPVHEQTLNSIKQCVNVARDLDKLELQVRKTNSESGWLQKAAEEMDIIFDEASCKYDKSESNKAKKAAEAKRKELQALLKKPLLPRDFNMRYPLYNPKGLESMNNENAIDVMKSSVVENVGKKKKMLKRKTKHLFKPKVDNSGSTGKIKFDIGNTKKSKVKFNNNNKKRSNRSKL